MRRWFAMQWSVAAVALLAVGCAAVKDQRGTVDAQRAAYYSRIVHDLADPSMEGRGPGTAGIHEARDYLVARLKRYGLEPAFGNSYTQPVEISLGTYAAVQRLYGGGHAAQVGEDFEAMGFSRSDAFEGAAVFVGYGIADASRNYDAYAEVEEDALAGRVAIAFRYEPMDGAGVSRWTRRAGRWTRSANLDDKARLAAQHGATALLIVDPPHRPRSGPLRGAAGTANLPGVNIPVMHVSTEWLEAMLDRAGHDGQAMLRQWQQAADRGAIVQPLDDVMLSGEVELATRRIVTDNVAGVLPGRGALVDEVVFVGAHYDHLGYGEVGSRAGEGEIHPGADDNASGTAGVLLLARDYARRYAAATDEDRRTVVLAFFTAEERGLLGSAYMVDHLHEMGIEVDDIVAMLNMDMIGRMREGRFYVMATGSGDRWEDWVRQANRGLGLDLVLQRAVPGNSDHVQFVNRDIPVLHFFTGFHEDYHMPSDTPEKINAAGALRGLRLIDAVLARTMTEPSRIVFTGQSGRTMDPHAATDAHGDVAMGGSAGGARLGIMPDYATSHGQEGAGVADVLSDPAAAAGLRKGDVITQWNDTPIANVEQLSAMLGRSDPGDEVSLTISRDGQTLEITLTLEAR